MNALYSSSYNYIQVDVLESEENGGKYVIEQELGNAKCGRNAIQGG